METQLDRSPSLDSLRVDRRSSFDPGCLLRGLWRVVQESERSCVLTDVPVSTLGLEDTLTSGEVWIPGNERMARLQARGHIPADAKIFQALWENQHLIPEDWKTERDGDAIYVYFDGTSLQREGGKPSVLVLCWYADAWHWHHERLDVPRNVNRPSAVIRLPHVAATAR